jgi:hypothetical protein
MPTLNGGTSRRCAQPRAKPHGYQPPMVLISTQDAHLKIISIFEIDEHFQSAGGA